MWFADIGLAMAWTVLASWVAVLTLVGRGRFSWGVWLSPPARGPVLIGTGAAAMLLVLQAGVVDTVADLSAVGPLDRTVWAWFVAHRSSLVTPTMAAVSRFGGTAGMAVLALVGAIVLWWARRRAEAGVLLAAAAGAGLLVTGFKHLYGRVRPPQAEQLIQETNAALPSGHALGSMVVLGMLAAVVVLLARRPVARAAGVVGAVTGVAAIGVSRLYLGVHWVTDVLTGWLLGGAWLALCVTALALLQHRHQPSAIPDPVAPMPDTTRGSRGDGAAAGW